jgi:hypothetical protein
MSLILIGAKESMATALTGDLRTTIGDFGSAWF